MSTMTGQLVVFAAMCGVALCMGIISLGQRMRQKEEHRRFEEHVRKTRRYLYGESAGGDDERG